MRSVTCAPASRTLCVYVWHGDSRCYVAFRGPGEPRKALVASFRSAFWRHGQAHYLPERRCWSVNLAERRRLDCWLAESAATFGVHVQAGEPLT